MNKNNVATIKGNVISDVEFSHETHGEKFYEGIIKTERTSGACDLIMFFIPEILLVTDLKGKKISVTGELRSDTKNENIDTYGKRQINYIFVNSFEIVNEYEEDEDEITLNGFVCFSHIKETAKTKRYLSEVMIATDRGKYNRSDYSPCLFWGRNAVFVSKLPVGTKISIKGRVQSRYFDKDGRRVDAIEVSVKEIISYEKPEEKEDKKDEENEIKNATIE